MTSNVLRFDFGKMARLATDDPMGFAHKREALIRQNIDREPRTEQLISLQEVLDHSSNQLVASGMHLGLHLTGIVLQTAALMAINMLALNKLMQESSLSNGIAGWNHKRFPI